MADDSGGDKSEKASAQKLKKTRQEGQVVRSRDLATAIGILVSLKLFVYMLPSYLLDFREIFHQAFAPLEGEGALENVMSTVWLSSAALLVKMVTPLFVVPLFIVLGAMVPGGWVMSAKNLEPKLERFNPVSNLGRLVSKKHGVELMLSIGKAAILGWVLVHVGTSTIKDYTRLQGLGLNDAMVSGANMMLNGVMAMVAVFIIFAIIDVPAQAYFFAEQQKMSKQELKEEYKTQEGRPEVRQRIRQLQRALAERSARKIIPGADVVIVNPQHYAVALKYDEKRAEAPFVLAKGVDEMALYIRQLAQEHGVEVLSLPPLARAIYNTSQVNQQIPMQLYQAVSMVLHYVLQLKAFREGRRPAQPNPLEATQVPVPSSMSEAAST